MATFTNEPFLFACCIVAGLSMVVSWFFGAKAFYAQRAPTPLPPDPMMCHAAVDPYQTEEWHIYRHKFHACGCTPS